MLKICKKNDFFHLNNLRYTILKKHVKYQDYDGNSALHYACIHCNFDIAAVLLKAGADPNIKNLDNLSPAYIASSKGDKEIIGLLEDFRGVMETKMKIEDFLVEK